MFDLRIGGIIAAAAFVLSLLIGIVSRSTMPMLIIRPLIFAVLFFIIISFVKILVERFLPELMDSDGMMGDAYQPGSRIDITEGDSQDFPSGGAAGGGFNGGFNPTAMKDAVMGARPDDSEEGIGDISALASKGSFARVQNQENFSGMDQNGEEGYNGAGESGNFSNSPMGDIFEGDMSFDSPSAAEWKPSSAESRKPSASGKAKPAAGGSADIFGGEDALPDLDSMAGAFMSSSSGEEPEESDFTGMGGPLKHSSVKPPAWTEDFNAKEIAAGLRTVLNKDKEG